jgi:hypothetical protein
MGCAPSFLFKHDDFKEIPFYNERVSPTNGKSVSFHKDMSAYTYKIISPKLITTFNNRRSRVEKAFPEILSELILIFESIETDIPRVKSVSDKKKIETKGKNQLTYLKIKTWDKTLTEEINARALKKAGFHELEVWNFIYFLVCVLTRLEQKKFAIDRVSFDDIVIQEKKFRYLYQPIFAQDKILLTTKEGKQHNRDNFPELYKQFKAILVFISLMVMPLDKILSVFDMEESKEIFTRLHEIIWVKYYPNETKSNSISRLI